MDGIGSGFVGYSIPGVPASLKEWIRPSLRYDLSNSTCHVNPPGGEMMSDHYGCRVVLPPGGGDTDEYTDAVRQRDMIYLVCRAPPSIHPFLGRHRATPYLLCLILVNVSMNRSRVVMATTFLRICVMKPEPRREGYSLLHNSVCTIRVVGVVMITIRMVTILQSGHNCGSIALMNR